MKHLTTEQEVKDRLGIDDFRHLSKDKVIEFVSLIPNTDKDIAINVISQFPEYSNMATNVVEHLKELCKTALLSGEKSNDSTISGFMIVLESLSEQIKKPNLSEEAQAEINKQMIDVAGKISDVNNEHKKWIKSLVNTGATICGVALVIGATILGVKIKNK